MTGIEERIQNIQVFFLYLIDESTMPVDQIKVNEIILWIDIIISSKPVKNQ